jgi:hypothetical protein
MEKSLMDEQLTARRYSIASAAATAGALLSPAVIWVANIVPGRRTLTTQKRGPFKERPQV